jgi:hypothetical protein
VELTSLTSSPTAGEPAGMSSDTDSDDSSANSGGSTPRGCESFLRQEQWPPSFCCPITQEPMHDPVVAMDGHSYESAVISEWLRTHHTSPVNGNRLASKVLVRNIALRNAMSEWNELLHNPPSGAPTKAGVAESRTNASCSGGVAAPGPDPEPEPEPEPEPQPGAEPRGEEVLSPQDSTPSDVHATNLRGPIVFEPQSEWEDLAATRRQRSMRTGGAGNLNHHWLNRVCMLLMMVALGLACWTMYVYDPWDPFPPDPEPPPPDHSTCRDCISAGCCSPCPPPWEKHWYPPSGKSLQRQLFKWDTWEPTRQEARMIGDAEFTGCEFHNPLPSLNNKTKGNNTRHSFERVNWIETRSAIQACDTDKKSSCIE